MGIEFRESAFLITGKTEAVARKGMLFNICVGFADLKNSSASDKVARTYALFIGDTALVKEDEPATILTLLKKRVKHVSVFLKVSFSYKMALLQIILCYLFSGADVRHYLTY